MVFLWYSYGFPWYSYGFPWYSYGFPMVFMVFQPMATPCDQDTWPVVSVSLQSGEAVLQGLDTAERLRNWQPLISTSNDYTPAIIVHVHIHTMYVYIYIYIHSMYIYIYMYTCIDIHNTRIYIFPHMYICTYQ